MRYPVYHHIEYLRAKLYGCLKVSRPFVNKVNHILIKYQYPFAKGSRIRIIYHPINFIIIVLCLVHLLQIIFHIIIRPVEFTHLATVKENFVISIEGIIIHKLKSIVCNIILCILQGFWLLDHYIAIIRDFLFKNLKPIAFWKSNNTEVIVWFLVLNFNHKFVSKFSDKNWSNFLLLFKINTNIFNLNIFQSYNCICFEIQG